jgi:acetyltransferase-like isoleucine patch superfamily enzyme
MVKKMKNIEDLLQIPSNKFHPLVYIGGKPEIGKNVCIGFFSEVNAKNANVRIGDNCDVASFVAINAADSHLRVLGLASEIGRNDITLEKNVFVGSHCFIGGGVHIGHHSIIAAGTVISKHVVIPPYSLVIGNPFVVKKGYYKKMIKKTS